MTTRIRVAILSGAVALLSFGCWLTKPPPVTPTSPDGGFPDATAGQRFTDCTQTAIHNDLVTKVIPAVETALATQDYVAELATLVGRFGIDEVVCAVGYVVDKSHGMAMATSDAIETDKEQRGTTWLMQQSVRVGKK